PLSMVFMGENILSCNYFPFESHFLLILSIVIFASMIKGMYRMVGICGLLICLWLMGTAVFASPRHRIAQVKALLETNTDQIAKADMLNDLSAAFLAVQVDSALAYARKAYDLSRKLNHTRGIGEARLNQTYALIRKGLLPDARATLKKAEVEFVQSEDVVGLGNVALCWVEFHLDGDRYLPGLASCLKADSLFLVAYSLDGQAKTRRTQARIFQLIGSDSLALHHLLQAETLLRDADSLIAPSDLPETLVEIAALQEKMGHPEDALVSVKKARDLFRKLDDRYAGVEVMLQQARLHGLLNQPALQVNLARAGLNMAQDVQDSTALTLANIGLGKALLAVGRPDSAEFYFVKALSWLQGRTDALGRNAAILGLSRTFLARQDYDGALLVTDSLFPGLDSAALALRLPLFALRQQIFERAGNSRMAADALRAFNLARNEKFRLEQEQHMREVEVRLAYAELQHGRSQGEVQEISTERYLGIINQHDFFLVIALSLVGFLLLLVMFLLWRGRRRRRFWQGRLKKGEEDLAEAEEDLLIVQQRLSDLREETFRPVAPVTPLPPAPVVDVDALVVQRTQELRLQVQKLSAQNKELDMFMYRASHDLLGPIARLKGLILLARRSDVNIKDMSHSIGLIEMVSVYMDRVLRKLILVHDLQHSNGSREPTNVAAMIEELTPRLSELPGISRPMILLHDEVESPVHLNPYLLRIVLENLLENACIFRADMASSRPRINVRLSRNEGQLVISLRDEGIGIAESVREQVFDIFFRGS
ncbi:MAG TPA: hypothetical protein ENJ82_11265, partial [Bacteroidetes bacterium]|nr:hypothetical protein [Bacteroidota bacterium]